MPRKKTEELPKKITLDELLDNPEEHYGSKVKIDNLIIDHITSDWISYATGVIAHNEGCHKRGVFLLYKKYGRSGLIVDLSKPGDKINIIGTLCRNYQPGYLCDYITKKHVSIHELENSRLPNLDF